MNDEPKVESKMEATDRLRKEGFWTWACLCRDHYREQFRKEGLSRSQANERAWEAMIDEFGALGDEVTELDGGYRYLAMSKFPPYCIYCIPHNSDEASFEEFWWVWSYCIGRLFFRIRKNRTCVRRADALARDQNYSNIDSLLRFARREPRLFLELIAINRLRRAVTYLQTNPAEPMHQDWEIEAALSLTTLLVSAASPAKLVA